MNRQQSRTPGIVAVIMLAMAGAARAEYRTVRVVSVPAVNAIVIADANAVRTVILPQLNASTDCHQSWANRWAQQMLPAETTLKWLPDPLEPRVYVDIAGVQVDYIHAALGAGAASVFPRYQDWRFYELAAKDLRLGIWSACANEDVFEKVAHEQNVARRLLYAVALTESGRQGSPWPWTLNVEGKGYFYSSRNEAHKALVTFLKSGHRSIDVGLMQVNLQFNGHRFANTWNALDPYANVGIGAQILRDNFARDSDPATAVAHYHSRTPARGAAYLQRVASHYRTALRNPQLQKESNP